MAEPSAAPADDTSHGGHHSAERRHQRRQHHQQTHRSQPGDEPAAAEPCAATNTETLARGLGLGTVDLGKETHIELDRKKEQREGSSL